MGKGVRQEEGYEGGKGNGEREREVGRGERGWRVYGRGGKEIRDGRN